MLLRYTCNMERHKGRIELLTTFAISMVLHFLLNLSALPGVNNFVSAEPLKISTKEGYGSGERINLPGLGEGVITTAHLFTEVELQELIKNGAIFLTPPGWQIKQDGSTAYEAIIFIPKLMSTIISKPLNTGSTTVANWPNSDIPKEIPTTHLRMLGPTNLKHVFINREQGLRIGPGDSGTTLIYKDPNTGELFYLGTFLNISRSGIGLIIFQPDGSSSAVTLKFNLAKSTIEFIPVTSTNAFLGVPLTTLLKQLPGDPTLTQFTGAYKPINFSKTK